MKQYRFKAELVPVDGIDATFVFVPLDTEKEFGKKGQVKVKTTIDGYPYRGSLAKMDKNQPHMLIVLQEVRRNIGKQAGDTVEIVLEEDLEERVVDVPADLHELLQLNPEAEAFFNSLSFTNRKEYAAWVNSAKRPETREKRLRETIMKLMEKKKNPSAK